MAMACTCFAQKQQYTTPVPILKQINRHNEDGSYSYGYEAADGSFKIETKAANGEVKGKYGYVDDSGNLREVAYGANHNGFQPTGDGINVAEAASGDRNPGSYPALAAGEIDDGQYREDPKIYEDPKYNSKPSKNSQFRVNASPAPAPVRSSFSSQPAYRAPQQQQQQQQQYYEEPQTQRPYYQSRFSAPAAPSYYQPQPQSNNYRSNNNNNYYHPDQVDIFQGHPASNLDLSTGSYSVTYG